MAETVKLSISWSETLDCQADVVLEIPEGSNAEEIRDMVLKGDPDVDWLSKVRDETRVIDGSVILNVEIKT
jgi:hypothetical protein